MQHPFVQTRIGCAISGAADSIYGVSLKWCSIILEAVPPYISSNCMLACLFSASAFSVILALRTNMVLTPQTWNEQGAIHYLPLNFNPTFPFQSQRKSVTRARGSRDLRPRVADFLGNKNGNRRHWIAFGRSTFASHRATPPCAPCMKGTGGLRGACPLVS